MRVLEFSVGSGEQPHLCAKCLTEAQKNAAVTEDGKWIGYYCPHTCTLALHLCMKGSIARTQLNGPMQAHEAQAQVDAIASDFRSTPGHAPHGRIQ